MNELSSIETDHLRLRLPVLLGNERAALAEFLVHLAEFDRRRGWEALNYATLWDYCDRELKLQKSCIYRRTNAARVVQKHPGASIERLRSGALTMTSLVLLKDVLTEQNAELVLSRAEWKSKDEVESIAAQLAPRPVPAPMIRRLPAAPSPIVDAPAPAPSPAPDVSTVVADPVVAAPVVEHTAAPHRPSSLERTALDGIDYSFRGVSTKAFVDKLRRAQEILSHAVPDGDPIKVLERALDDLIAKHAKTTEEPARKRNAEASSASASTPKKEAVKRSRHIPAATARNVRRRDGHACSFVLADGTRCGSSWKLELDHIRAWALGGLSTVDNLRVVCAAHNTLHARRTFGDAVVDNQRTGSVAPERLDRVALSEG